MIATSAAEIRCQFCGYLVIERAAAPWRYSCRRCKGAQSSTGYVRQPSEPKYQGWRRAS